MITITIKLANNKNSIDAIAKLRYIDKDNDISTSLEHKFPNYDKKYDDTLATLCILTLAVEHVTFGFRSNATIHIQDKTTIDILNGVAEPEQRLKNQLRKLQMILNNFKSYVIKYYE